MNQSAFLLTGLLALAASPAALAGPRVPPLRPGDPLPPLVGEFLTGRRAELPAASRGRVALLLLGFSYESRHAVEAWNDRFVRAFAGDTLVTSFEVPMLGGAARLAKPFIDGGMRRGTPRALHERVITVWRDTGDWKPRVGFTDRDAAYLVVLDPTGHVAWLHHGPVDESGWSALEHATREARATLER